MTDSSYPEGKRRKVACVLFGHKHHSLGFCERDCGHFLHTTGYGLYMNYIPNLPEPLEGRPEPGGLPSVAEIRGDD